MLLPVPRHTGGVRASRRERRGAADAVLAQAATYRGAFPTSATGGASTVLGWALAHVGRFHYNLGPPTDRGGTIQQMQTRELAGSTCDCSMFVRWAMAQAGIDVGLSTVSQWPANGLLSTSEAAAQTPLVARGVGPNPPAGGYRAGDIIFFGHGEGAAGHDALWLGDGQIGSPPVAAARSPPSRSAGKLALIAWQMLSRGEDYAFGRPSLSREKIAGSS